ncbi:hypothetical protein R0K17_02900 [Planococcus sp. SIMBA_143]
MGDKIKPPAGNGLRQKLLDGWVIAHLSASENEGQKYDISKLKSQEMDREKQKFDDLMDDDWF